MKAIKGHGLLNEGDGWDDPAEYVLRKPWLAKRNHDGHAICRCGAQSPPLPSNAARRRWHRHHKLAVISATGVS